MARVGTGREGRPLRICRDRSVSGVEFPGLRRGGRVRKDLETTVPTAATTWPVTEDGHVIWTRSPFLERVFDWSATWQENLREAKHVALAYAEDIPPGCGSVVEVDWINESDVL